MNNVFTLLGNYFRHGVSFLLLLCFYSIYVYNETVESHIVMILKNIKQILDPFIQNCNNNFSGEPKISKDPRKVKFNRTLLFKS